MGDITNAQYMAERQEIQAQLARLNVNGKEADYLSKVAQFLDNLALAWQAASQERKNQLAAELFEAVWVKDRLAQAVTPKPEMVPFFDLVYAEAVKNAVAVAAPTGIEPAF